MSDDLDQRIRELDALRNRIIHVVGHALRTPTTTIHGLAAAIDEADEARIREVIGPALLRCSSTLERLLDDLLLAARVTTTLPVGAPQAVELQAAARAAWQALGHGELVCGSGGKVWGMAHARSADRILSALLDNAARYGEGPPEVAAEVQGQHAVVSVSSGGPTVPDRELALAFEPFWRSERAVLHSPGLGLGLTIARALARHAGGDVVLEQRSGGGVRALLLLPGSPRAE